MYLQVFICKYLIREYSKYTIYNFYVLTGIYLQVFNKRIFKIYNIQFLFIYKYLIREKKEVKTNFLVYLQDCSTIKIEVKLHPVVPYLPY